MSVANPRTRLVSFRISEHDYARLRIVSSAQGAHSLADFIRSTVNWAMDGVPDRISPSGGGSTLGLSLRTANPGESTAFPFGTGPSSLEFLSRQVATLRRRAESLQQELQDLISTLHAMGATVKNCFPESDQRPRLLDEV